jgi:predicted MFS family arabinose efflux permease
MVPQPDTDLDEDRLTVGNALRNYATLLRQGAIVAAVGAYFLMFLGIGLFVVFLPTWLETTVGVSSNQVALLFAIGGAANVLASPVAGSLSDRIGRKPLVITSCVGMSALILATTFVIDGFAMAAVLFFGTMVMVGMRISPLQSLLTALVPDRRRGLLMGMAVGIGYGGIGLGSVVAGALYARFSYLSNTAAAAVVMLAMALLVWKGLPEPRLARPAQAKASGNGHASADGAPTTTPAVPEADG